MSGAPYRLAPSFNTVAQTYLPNTMPQNANSTATRGYPDLAKVMGAHKGMSIYLRFSDLNARDLLVYQAEILELEQLLEARDQITPWAKTNILKPFGEQRTAMEEEHWKVQMQLRDKLKEYSMSSSNSER